MEFCRSGKVGTLKEINLRPVTDHPLSGTWVLGCAKWAVFGRTVLPSFATVKDLVSLPFVTANTINTYRAVKEKVKAISLENGYLNAFFQASSPFFGCKDKITISSYLCEAMPRPR